MAETHTVHALTGGMPASLNPNDRRLSQVLTEEITGAVGTAITLAHRMAAVVLLAKNGQVQPSSAYTITGDTLSLTVAAVATDVFLLFGFFTT